MASRRWPGGLPDDQLRFEDDPAVLVGVAVGRLVKEQPGRGVPELLAGWRTEVSGTASVARESTGG